MISYDIWKDMACEYFDLTEDELEYNISIKENEKIRGLELAVYVKDWFNPTVSEINQFYSNSLGYLYNLLSIAKTNDKCTKDRIKEWGEMLKHRYKTVVDYGAGLGWAGCMFYDMGYEVTFVDVAGKMYDFVKWVYTQLGYNIKFIDVNNECQLPLKEKYDIVLCLDLLEHLVNMEEVLGHVVDHIQSGGALIETTYFVSDRCGHLKKNNVWRYREGELFKKYDLLTTGIMGWSDTTMVWVKK